MPILRPYVGESLPYTRETWQAFSAVGWQIKTLTKFWRLAGRIRTGAVSNVIHAKSDLHG